MMQWQRAGCAVEALNVVVQASAIDSFDAAKLTALVQNAQSSDEEDDLDAPGVPAAAVYQSHSGSNRGDCTGLESEGQITARRCSPH